MIYRYAWAERAKVWQECQNDSPQEALGHNSKAVHRALRETGLDENSVIGRI